ncbi:hypothetical protein [Aestuariibacter sp. A3R04]|uniref:hypothetical protein n=1 Tax=Aestuariibacter sp. A3R04 TaxID=2841571 RepID=UPI001C09C01D|nr:hypothetical protein [Aestuariibacter sp. A3R04]MBU3022880.1 hypothetical protein [Aestuariibacter sp. A3R04]
MPVVNQPNIKAIIQAAAADIIGDVTSQGELTRGVVATESADIETLVSSESGAVSSKVDEVNALVASETGDIDVALSAVAAKLAYIEAEQTAQAATLTTLETNQSDLMTKSGVKSVQRGVYVLYSSDTSKDLTISAVDMNKAVLMQAATTSSTNINLLGSAYLKNATTITFEKGYTGGTCEITWQLIEYE